MSKYIDNANPDDIGYPWEQDDWEELTALTPAEHDKLVQDSLHGLDDAGEEYYKEPF